MVSLIMPKRTRRSFTDEFKNGAVRLVLDGGKTTAQVARDLALTARPSSRARAGEVARGLHTSNVGATWTKETYSTAKRRADARATA